MTSYYLTHVPPHGADSFSPSGVTGSGNTEGGRTWSETPPTSYALPHDFSEGDHFLYLWVANVEGTPIGGVRASNVFTFDTRAPSTPTLHATKKPASNDKGAIARFGKLTSVDASGGTVSFSYCLTNCGERDSVFTAIQNWPLRVDTDDVKDYSITFKATDKLGHVSSTSYPWRKVNCLSTDAPQTDPTFTQGTKAKSCGVNGDWPVNWTITCTNSATHGVNADKTACITCGAGEYLKKGVCVRVNNGVNTNYVSEANSIIRERCGASHHANGDSSACVSNDCSGELGLGSPVGQRTVHGGACQLISCGGGYYEDTDGRQGQCSPVPANSGKYSSNGDKSLSDCDPNPEGSNWNYVAGSASAPADCNWDCQGDYTEYNSIACYPATKVCNLVDRDGTKIGEGTQDYTVGTAGDYGACGNATSCVIATHTFHGSACYANSKVCLSSELPAHAASGTKTYDSNNGRYDPCVVDTCEERLRKETRWYGLCSPYEVDGDKFKKDSDDRSSQKGNPKSHPEYRSGPFCKGVPLLPHPCGSFRFYPDGKDRGFNGHRRRSIMVRQRQ